MRGWWFAAWVVVGALGAFTVIGAASVGLAFAPLFLVALFVVSRRTHHALDRIGFVVGVGLVCLAVAYINRNGPLDPQPWLLAGLACAGGSLAGYASLRTVSRRHPCRRDSK